MDIIIGIILAIIGILFGWGKFQNWRGDYYKNQVDAANQNAQDWQNFGETQQQNSQIDQDQFVKENEINKQNETDKIIDDNTNAGTWK